MQRSPIEELDPETPMEPTAEPAPLVLLVDDDRAVLLTLRAYARGAGLACRCAGDGLQAWAMLAGGLRPDAVVTDIEMPNLDGPGLIGRIRSDPALAAVPVLVYSGSARPAGGHDADAWFDKGRPGALVAALGGLAARVLTEPQH
jgi:two-component system, chemotaxis family, chemotaxis protein CheY